jgi:hypothetical protein
MPGIPDETGEIDPLIMLMSAEYYTKLDGLSNELDAARISFLKTAGIFTTYDHSPGMHHATHHKGEVACSAFAAVAEHLIHTPGYSPDMTRNTLLELFGGDHELRLNHFHKMTDDPVFKETGLEAIYPVQELIDDTDTPIEEWVRKLCVLQKELTLSEIEVLYEHAKITKKSQQPLKLTSTKVAIAGIAAVGITLLSRTKRK